MEGTNAIVNVSLPFDRDRIPARDPVAAPNLIDLTEYYTSSLDRCSYLDADGNCMQLDLRKGPKGLVNFHGVPFDFRGIIQLAWACGSGAMVGFAHSVEGISVRQPCVRWHAILGSTGNGAEGEVIGSLVLRYPDGGREELEIIYGRHVRHWRTDGDSRTDTDLARVAWEGPHAFWYFPDARLRIYHAVWDNPRPDQEIVSFDFVSKMTTTAAPFLIDRKSVV